MFYRKDNGYKQFLLIEILWKSLSINFKCGLLGNEKQKKNHSYGMWTQYVFLAQVNHACAKTNNCKVNFLWLFFFLPIKPIVIKEKKKQVNYSLTFVLHSDDKLVKGKVCDASKKIEAQRQMAQLKQRTHRRERE